MEHEEKEHITDMLLHGDILCEDIEKAESALHILGADLSIFDQYAKDLQMFLSHCRIEENDSGLTPGLATLYGNRVLDLQTSVRRFNEKMASLLRTAEEFQSIIDPMTNEKFEDIQQNGEAKKEVFAEAGGVWVHASEAEIIAFLPFLSSVRAEKIGKKENTVRDVFCPYLKEALILAKRQGPVFSPCPIDISVFMIYGPESGEYVVDHDNIHIKYVFDYLCAYVGIDDNGILCGHHFDSFVTSELEEGCYIIITPKSYEKGKLYIEEMLKKHGAN